MNNKLAFISQLYSNVTTEILDLTTERGMATAKRAEEIEIELAALMAYQESLGKAKCEVYVQRGAADWIKQYNTGLISLDELVEGLALIALTEGDR